MAHGGQWAPELQDYTAREPFCRSQKVGDAELESTRTRLNSFSDEERARMINWGYLQCDLSIRSYYLKDADPPSSLPYPGYDFARPPGETSAT